MLHHVELWVADLGAARAEWGWLLERLGWTRGDSWGQGSTWNSGATSITLTTSPNLHGDVHDRRMPGLNHLAFGAGESSAVDAIMAEAPSHGWHPLYAERYPHDGGSDHYAGWLENTAGFKAEIVAA